MPRRVSFRKQSPEARRTAELFGRINRFEKETAFDLEGWPEKKAELTWKKEGLVFSIVKKDCGIPEDEIRRMGLKHLRPFHYNGYVRFPKRPVREKSYDGIITYVPVHGGVTFAVEDVDGSMVYGFDTNHAGDEDRADQLNDMVWMKKECESMATAIRILRKYEYRYRRRHSVIGKAMLLDQLTQRVGNHMGKINPTMNMGVMIKMLSGDL